MVQLTRRSAKANVTDEPGPFGANAVLRDGYQYASELRTSARFLVPSARYTFGLIELLMKCTDPSANEKFRPPGCRLRKPHWPSCKHGPPGIAAFLSQSGGCAAPAKQALAMAPV